jgi:hypothetical protein
MKLKQILSLVFALALTGTLLNGCDRGGDGAGPGGTTPDQPKRSAPSGGSGGAKY